MMGSITSYDRRGREPTLATQEAVPFMGLELGLCSKSSAQTGHGATVINQRDLGYERRGVFMEAKEERQML